MTDINDTTSCVPGMSVVFLHDPYMYINQSALYIPHDIPVIEIVIKLSYYVIVFVIDMIGNSIVIIINIVNKHMRTQTNMFILNLAVSDLLVGCFCMWMNAGSSITPEFPFGQYVCKGNNFIQVAVMTSSVMTLTAISIERFFAICYPLMPKVSPKLITIVIIIIWIISIAMGSPQLIIRNIYEFYFKDRHQVACYSFWPQFYDNDCTLTDQGASKLYSTIRIVVVYFIPIVIMVCAYIMIFYKMVTRKQPGTVLPSAANNQQRRRKKVICMLVALMTTFIVCWTPLHGLNLWAYYIKTDRMPIPEDVRSKFQYATLFIAHLCSAINPILYGGFNSNFRKGFKAAFDCILLKRQTSDVGA